MLSDPDSSSDLVHSLSHVELDFLDAITNGPAAAEMFLSRFTELYDLTVQCKTSGLVTSVAQTVAGNVASMASAFMELDSNAVNLGAELDNELSDIFQSLSLDGKSARKADVASVQPSSIIERPPPSDSKGTCGKSRLAVASQSWLIQHVHEPFPPLRIKQTIVDESRCSWKALDDWFTSARRKIGWTAFSKRYFKGNRCLTLDCAHRVMVKGKGQEYSEEIRRDLQEIQATAERLYGNSRNNTGTDTSSFAKELESIEAQASVSSSKSRKRRPSTSSTTTGHSSSSTPSTSSSSSRKRSRASSEESDTTCYSESSETDSCRASKRARSVSPTFSCISQGSSYSASSSDTADTVSEISTPKISPTYPSLPVEIIDNWIDDVSAAPIFPPHDIVDGPQSVLSQKRRSPELESDSPAKRARLSGPQTLPSEESDNPVSESRPIASAAQAEPVQPSPVQPLSDEPAGWSPVYGAPVLQPSTELDEETMDFLLSQMDFNIPQAAVPDWGQDILKSVVEVCPFDFASIDLGIGSSIGFPDDYSSMFTNSLDPCSPLPASGDLLPDMRAPVLEKQPESAGATNASFLPNDLITSTKDQSAISGHFASTPLSLTSEELEFLESLGNTSQPPLPDVGPALSHDGKSAVPLIDFVHPFVAPTHAECNESGNGKFQLASQLLEAQKLQQEVFG